MRIVFWVLIIIVFVLIHALIGLYVDKYKKLKKEKATIFSLIPFSNVYLLGKHTFSILVGALLFIALLFVVDLSIMIKDVRYGLIIIDDNLRNTLFISYLIITVFILVCAIRKYNVITKNKDTFKFDDLMYYLKETLWILAFFIAIYIFILLISMFV